MTHCSVGALARAAFAIALAIGALLASAVTANAAYKDTVLATPGLISYYQLNDPVGSLSALDEKGVQNGTYYGSVGFTKPGAIAGETTKSVVFPSLSDYMLAPHTAAQVVNAFSVEMWVYLDSYGDTSTWRILGEKGNWINSRNWMLSLVAGSQARPHMSFSDGIDLWGKASDTNLELGRWYHLVYTHIPGVKYQLFINGQLDTELLDTRNPIQTSTAPLQLGPNWDNNAPARFDHFAVYNQALTATQVSQHFAGGDAARPDTTISGGPSGLINSASATFGLSSSQTGSTFECKLDAGPWSACGTSPAYSGLADGAHTFQARAYDPSDNVDDTPASRAFTVDTVATDTTIESGDSGTITSSTAGWGFSAPEANATFECRIDGGAWTACTSPKSYGNLREGSHTFDVRSVDTAGNRDPSPATRTIEVVSTYKDMVRGTSGVVGYWRLGETSGDTALDETGTQNGGYYGSTLRNQPGALATSVNRSTGFGPPDDDVLVPDNAAQRLDGYSAEVWLFLNSYGNTSQWRSFFRRGGGTTDRNFLLALAAGTQGRVHYSYSDGVNYHGKTGSTNLQLGRWYHLVMSHYAGSRTQLYINGELESEFIDPATPVHVPAWITMGSDGPPSPDLRLDEAAIYNRPLTSSEVDTHFREGDTATPASSFTSGPNGLTNSSTATLGFTSSDSGSTFECQLDSGAWSACSSPKSYAGLADGSHAVSVRATDPAGNLEASPAVRTFTVDTVAPDTSITSAPTGTVTSNDPTFAFSSPETTATFECKLDGGAWAACTSPKKYSNLSDATHTFSVRAVDEAGNPDGTPASQTWTISSQYNGIVASTPGLVGYWRAGEAPGATTAHDEKSVTDGTFSSGAGLGIPGALAHSGNTAMQVDGPFDELLIPDNAAYRLDAFSVELWVNLDSYGNTNWWRPLLSKGTGPTTRNYMLTLAQGTNGFVHYSMGDGTTDFVAGRSNTELQLHRWYHLVYTHVPGQKLQLYVNGQLDSEKATTLTPPTSTNRIHFGSYGCDCEFVPARFDEFALYNQVLTPTQVQQHYAEGDTTPPDTSIGAGPTGTTNNASPTFAISSTDWDATFECRMDSGPWAACGASKTYTNLPDGSHVLSARAYDVHGNADQSPAAQSFTVDTVAPDTTLSGAPSGVVNTSSASISFASPEVGATFECRVDGGSWAACTSPKSYSSLSDGQHTFEVRALDLAGNPDPTPATATWTVSAFKLLAPDTVHSDGAELDWARWPGTGTFGGYEVHRSSSAGFTPSASTLLAKVGDQEITHYRDTTGAAGGTFTYKVVAEGNTTAGQTVTLPADGHARKDLQGDATHGDATYIRSVACDNHGGASVVKVGTTEDNSHRYRGLVQFDLRDIPPDATISSAVLGMYMTAAPGASVDVQARRATGEWVEGSGQGTCTGDGASWREANAGIKWNNVGGDYADAVTDHKAHSSTDAAGRDSFDVTGDVRDFIDATAPNLGWVLKADDETPTSGATVLYGSDSAAVASQRPQLTVDYTDGSHAQGPSVDVSSPGPGDTVSGTSVQLAAGASDDRNVDSVQFFVDGNSVGTDTTAPFAVTWNSTTVTEGNHSVLAKAIDDAGNATNSGSVSFKVANSAAPQTRVMSPSDKYQDMVRADKPAGYWRLNDTTGTTVSDISGNNRNGTLAGSYLLGQLGLLSNDTDKSILFKNATNSSTSDGQATVSGLTGQMGQKVTAEAWVKTTGVSTSGTFNRVLARNWQSTGGWMLALTNTSGQQKAQFSVASGASTAVTATGNVGTGTLHLVGTYDGSTVRLYVNGVQAGTASVANLALNTSANLVMAQTLNNDMTTDEAAVYDSALSAEQVKEHYDVGQARVPTVSGTTTVTADATDDKGVDHVDFYVDDVKFGESSSPPYRATLNTLDPALPLYDGTHAITVKAYDAAAQGTASSPASVTVANAANTKYKADITTTAPPATVTYDPSATTQVKSGVDVTVKNTSAQTWSSTDVVLKPQWIPPDPNATPVDAPDVPLGSALAPNATVTKTVLVDPPTLADGTNQARYVLRFDVQEKSTNTNFAARGNKPNDNPVIVNKALLVGEGLEEFWEYDHEELGAGMQHLVNIANGNSIVRFTPFESPGRGLNTVVGMTYNALEKKSESPIGNNWSLSVSSLSRFGNPIDVHPNKADTIAGNAKKFIEFTDGDGTTWRFNQNANGGWDEPPGVHLYLREYSTTDTTRKWAFTRPDRTTFFYDSDGYPTGVEDNNGNRITYTLENTPPAEDPGGPKKRITAITDAGGRSFNLTYYSKGDAKKPQIRGKVKRITDHSGRAFDFVYYEDGNLLRLIQRGGTKADGSLLVDRSWVFTYTTANGDLPAIADAAARQSPDPKIGNQSTRLFSVIDPRNNETTFTYLGSGAGNDRWKIASRTNRANDVTSYAYDTTSQTTTVSAPLSRTSKYRYDSEGKVTKLTNAKSEDTLFDWTVDREIHMITEPSGGTLTYDYDSNGSVVDEYDELGNHTHRDYSSVPVDSNDVQGKWKAGRTIPHATELSAVTTPKGTQTSDANDYKTTFDYDAAGNLRHRWDAEAQPGHAFSGQATTFDYNADGTLNRKTDANGHATTYGPYDANGLPTQIIDAAGGAWQFGYDADGLRVWIQDANHASDPVTASARSSADDYRSYFDYDSFRRLGRQSTPKSTRLAPGTLIWSDSDYDANDNQTTSIAPHYGTDDGLNGSRTTAAFDPMDRPTLVTEPGDRESDSVGRRTKYDYDAAGRLKSETLPKGVATASVDRDFATFYDYDALDRVIRETRYDTDAGGGVTKALTTHSCYDASGDLRRVTGPGAKLASVDCDAAPAPYTEQFDYDLAHRLTRRTDPPSQDSTLRTSDTTYDANGNVATETDQSGKVTRFSYDARDKETAETVPFDGSRTLTSLTNYDAVGNVIRRVSPRGADASSGSTDDYATKFDYDALNRVTRTSLPRAGGSTALYIYSGYDANGNTTAVTQPTTATDPAAVGPADKTTVEYFDAGWVAEVTNPGDNPTRYDYRAEGWQTKRTPLLPANGDSGGAQYAEDTAHRVLTDYYPSGQPQRETSRNGLVTEYGYDADNLLVSAVDASGVTSDGIRPIDTVHSYDGFDREVKTRTREKGASLWDVTTTAYDESDNVIERVDSAREDDSGTTTAAGNRTVFTYDGADRIVDYVDYGSASTASDDIHGINHFSARGWPTQQVVKMRDASGTFATKQVTDRAYFDNGKLRTLTTKNGAGTTLETHSLSYEDGSGGYVNGKRTQDRFSMLGPKGDAKCRTATCTTSYDYDALDRPTKETRTREGATSWSDYTLNPAGAVTKELRSDGRQVLKSYNGTRLTRVETSKSGFPTYAQKYFYDGAGDLDCVTTDTGTAATCNSADGTARDPQLHADYSYDGRGRLTAYRSWKPDGSRDADAAYVYDALSRVRLEEEQHGTAASTRSLDYRGTSDHVVYERIYGGLQRQPSGAADETKTYTYDGAGSRTGLTDTRRSTTGGSSSSKTYTYGEDVHGSVSMLVDENGDSKGSYAYDTYGGEDAELTQEKAPRRDDLTQEQITGKFDTLNPYRYASKRLDSGTADDTGNPTDPTNTRALAGGSGNIDMGSRRFDLNTGRYLQEDQFDAADDDLELTGVEQTRDRYGLAGGDPVNFTEADGHSAGADASTASNDEHNWSRTITRHVVDQDESQKEYSRIVVQMGIHLNNRWANPRFSFQVIWGASVRSNPMKIRCRRDRTITPDLTCGEKLRKNSRYVREWTPEWWHPPGGFRLKGDHTYHLDYDHAVMIRAKPNQIFPFEDGPVKSKTIHCHGSEGPNQCHF